MSRENVEVVKRANEAFNMHDLDSWQGFLHPEFAFVDHGGAVGEEAGSGIEAIRGLVEGWLETFPDFRADIEEFIDIGERVVCVVHWQGTGAASGFDYSVHAADITTV